MRIRGRIPIVSSRRAATTVIDADHPEAPFVEVVLPGGTVVPYVTAIDLGEPKRFRAIRRCPDDGRPLMDRSGEWIREWHTRPFHLRDRRTGRTWLGAG